MPQRIIMAKSSQTKGKKRRVSPLGVLLVILMLLLSAVTLAVNYFFRDGNAPAFGKYSFCYYTADEIPTVIPSGSMVIAEKADAVTKDSIVLYRTTLNTYRIARTALTDPAAGLTPEKPLIYLTVETVPTPVQVTKSDILGVCRFKSPELGVVAGFLISTVGVLIGLILPCLVLLLYITAAVVAAKEEAALEEDDDFEDEDDTDLEFVKSIQKKQQQIAERDAERHAGETGEAPAKKPRRLTDEEIAEMEEQEAARRAERIAQVRSHMEQRRQSNDTLDGVPLYTTEVITRTHPLPKTGELSMTRQQPAVKPGMTGQIKKKAVQAEMQKTAVRPITKPIMTAEEAAKPAPAPAPEQPAPAPAPAKPAAPPATYDELMGMLDKLKSSVK